MPETSDEGSAAFRRLKRAITDLSVARDWDEVRKEWYFAYAYVLEPDEGMDTCQCGHEIKELCYIRNRRNAQETYVGNVCLRLFLGVQAAGIFLGIRKIREDLDKTPSKALVDYARRFEIISVLEWSFLRSIARRRKLHSDMQIIRRELNRKILTAVTRPPASITSSDAPLQERRLGEDDQYHVVNPRRVLS